MQCSPIYAPYYPAAGANAVNIQIFEPKAYASAPSAAPVPPMPQYSNQVYQYPQGSMYYPGVPFYPPFYPPYQPVQMPPLPQPPVAPASQPASPAPVAQPPVAPPPVIQPPVAPVSQPTSPAQVAHKNNLKSMFINNEASILAVNLRMMNPTDLDGNGLIQGSEESGNFINAVERLDEIKALGINTLHILPFHPPGKTKAMGVAGSLYAPADFLAIDPMLKDPKDPRSVEEQCKYFVDECHKRGIKVMLDLPSCASLDFAEKHPELMAKEKDGTDKTPGGWQDIRMFEPWQDKEKKILNRPLLEMHKQYVDKAVEYGMDGIRADVARAKPIEFWNVIIPYSRSKDPEFGWLAETYTYEDASPQLNMPADRPHDQLKAGFDTYYGQYHIFNQWNKAQNLYDYVIGNIGMSNNSKDGPKSLIGSFSTHDDQSPMFYGGAPWVMLTTGLQATLPQINPYFVDGVQTGDYYLYPYENAKVSGTSTDSSTATVHRGRLDIFNPGVKPQGPAPEIGIFMQQAMSLKNGAYKEVINKGSFIPLQTDNDDIIAFARHQDGKTLLVVANRNVNRTTNGTIIVPGLRQDQSLQNLVPNYGEKSQFQKENGKLKVSLGTSRFHVFEINSPNIERARGLKIYKQK